MTSSLSLKLRQQVLSIPHEVYRVSQIFLQGCPVWPWYIDASQLTQTHLTAADALPRAPNASHTLYLPMHSSLQTSSSYEASLFFGCCVKSALHMMNYHM